jgi:hypothetical protein
MPFDLNFYNPSLAQVVQTHFLPIQLALLTFLMSTDLGVIKQTGVHGVALQIGQFAGPPARGLMRVRASFRVLTEFGVLTFRLPARMAEVHQIYSRAKQSRRGSTWLSYSSGRFDPE